MNNIATQSCYYDPINTTSSVTGNIAGNSCSSQHVNASVTGAGATAAMYPSMSVNVSMNMTMHGYGAADATMPMQCSQVSLFLIFYYLNSFRFASTEDN